MCFNMTYGKQITNTVKLTTWGNVHYNHLIALPFLLPLVLFSGELKTFPGYMLDYANVSLLLISAVVGKLNQVSFFTNGTFGAKRFISFCSEKNKSTVEYEFGDKCL